MFHRKGFMAGASIARLMKDQVERPGQEDEQPHNRNCGQPGIENHTANVPRRVGNLMQIDLAAFRHHVKRARVPRGLIRAAAILCMSATC